MSLVINLLGTFQVTWADRPLKFATEHSRALLAYLTVEADVIHQRSALATLLWPEENEPRARQNLRQALLFLKRTLDGTAIRDGIFDITSTTLQWHSQGVVVDLHMVQQVWRHSQSHSHVSVQQCVTCIQAFTQAVARYQGEFLQGLFLRGNQPFEEWALLLREQTHRQAMAMLENLTAHYLTQAAYDAVQHYAARQVTLEPWHEQAHRQLMLALAAQGQPIAALRQYESCRQILQQELGVPPAAETTKLYEQIRTGQRLEVAPPRTKESPARRRARAPRSAAVVAAPKRLHNLPATGAPLVGRSEQLAQLHALISNRSERLLTIAGIGGMGKSRLALTFLAALAAESPPPFTDGVWFVPLIGVADAATTLPDALAGATLKAVGMMTPDQAALQHALFHYIAPRNLLLVFDNFEHLLLEEQSATAATAFVLALLHAAPGATLLITSRLPLQLLPETVIRLEGLPVPAGPLSTVDQRDAANYESIRLFVYHAQRTRPSFTLGEENLPAVIDLCRALSGMPLAIELAAALTPHFTPHELVATIRQNLAILVSPRRDLDARHRQFSAVLHSSWQLLSACEQQVLMQCAIFVGRFSRTAALTITGTTVSTLTDLVDKSLIQQLGVGVYQLHELLRQFADQQLTMVAGEFSQALQRRYVDYYLGFIADCTPQLHQRGAQTIAAKLREVGENCRQAWHIALEQRWLAPMNAAVEGWTRYWVMTGRHREGEALLAAALAVLEAPAAASTAPGDEQRLRAKLWLAYAQCLQGQERIKGCLDAAKTAGTLALACDEVACYAKAQALYATGLCLQLRHAEARPFAEQAYQSGIWEAQIDALITLAGYESDIHSHVTVTAQALQIAQQHDDPYLILLCTQHLAGSYENQGYYAHSLSYRKQALELACALQDTYLSGEAHYLYGLVHAHLGLYEGSIEQLQQALALAQQHSVAWLERRTLNRLAYSHYWLGHLDTAYAFAQQVQKMQHQDEELFVFGDFVYAQILDARGQWCDAERIYQQILTHKRAHSARGATTLLPELAALAALALQQGDQRQALCYVEEILVIVATEGGNREGNIFTPPLYFNAYAIDLACYTVLHALGDERAQQVLATGHQRLWAQVEQIAELPLRQSYIENVAANQALYLALA